MAFDDWRDDDGESWKQGPPTGDFDDLTLGLDPDGPSADDLDRFGDELDTCPACGGPIYDQADICPRCGHRMVRQPTTPAWAGWLATLVLVALLLGAGGATLIAWVF